VNETAAPAAPTEGARPRILWLNSIWLTVVPVLTVAACGWYLSEYGITWMELVAAGVMWMATGIGITAGYHRLFSHRGYKAHPALRAFYALLGAAASQNSIIAWCADHRRHHSDTDTDEDPYNALRGFFWSHMGWILVEGRHEGDTGNVPDLHKDPICAWQHKHILKLTFGVNLAMVALAAWLSGRWLGMFLFAGLLRVIVVQHFTFTINSLAHMWGSQPWSRANSSRDNWFLSLLSFGEGYHNYHHSFQWDYRNGPRWYNYDPSKWFIWAMSKVGVTSELRRTHDDVVLRTRFDEQRRGFTERLEQWGEAKMQEWSAALQRRGEELAQRKEALRARLLEVESQVEESLQDLKRRRHEWAELQMARAKEKSAELRRAARRELRQMERAIKEARREAERRMQLWQAAVSEYSERFAPVAAGATA
jgi:stearoyl-CoA desaturase (delta-9 desaturase)